MKIKLLFKLLAPYFAVGIFWCAMSNAWLAILAYHSQILFWSRKDSFAIPGPSRPRMFLLALPTLLAGPALYYLLPFISQTDLSVWLTDHSLSRTALLVMIPYFGLVHPYLEQVYWGPLRERTPWAHPLFAGYHLLVLFSLLTPIWLAICFALLLAASVAWQFTATRTGGLAVPVLSHILADLGVVVVAWLSI